MNEIIIPALIVGGIGLFFGLLNAVAGIIFHVEKDERIPIIEEALPGANCGGCGYAGCSAYAEAVASGEAEGNLCSAGGAETAKNISEIMGSSLEFIKKYALVNCVGKAHKKYEYGDVADCSYAEALSGGSKNCMQGCIGLGNCVRVCNFDALEMKDGVPVVDRSKCTGCGACVKACPRNIITLVPEVAKVAVLCKCKEKITNMKNVCDSGCIGCNKCTKVCEAGAIKVTDNFATIDYELCTGCGECEKVCPRKIIRYIE